MKKLLIILTTLFVCIITITSGIYVGYRHPEWLGLKKSGEVVKVRINTGNRTGGLTTDSAQYQEIDFSAFWDAWDIIRTRHVNRPGDTNELIYGAINGMLQYGFNDQFSSFLPPLINEVASEDLSGSFSGVGIELEMIQGKVTVVAPLSGTPGEKAGILSGDIITAIDGEVIDGLTLLEAVRKIRGPSGTDVVLSISRALDTGEIKDFDQTITRGTVDVKSVDWEAKDNGIYVIKIRNFAGDTNREWDAAVAEIAQKSPQGIVLDLRNNAGGYVNSAVHIISEFVPSGVAVTEDLSLIHI